MNRRSLLAAVAATLCLAAVPSIAGPGSAGHSHDDGNFSAGEPGDPKKPARVIHITMREKDGRMIFDQERIVIRRGEQVRFIIRNNGEIEHEFVLATVEENDKHAEQMRKHPDMEHDDPNAKRVAPKKTSVIVWRFTRAGTFEFGCLIPGHREAGMRGTIVVV